MSNVNAHMPLVHGIQAIRQQQASDGEVKVDDTAEAMILPRFSMLYICFVFSALALTNVNLELISVTSHNHIYGKV